MTFYWSALADGRTRLTLVWRYVSSCVLHGLPLGKREVSIIVCINILEQVLNGIQPIPPEYMVTSAEVMAVSVSRPPQNVGIALDDRGRIPVDNHFKTSVPK